MEDLEEFIDQYYYECVMEGPADNPNKRKKTDSATDTQDLLSSEFSVLESINKKLEVLGMLHQEIKDLKVSLEFTYQQISDLQQNNAELRSTLAAVASDVDLLKKENKLLKETVLDVQSRSMRDNLIISGIPESTPDNPEVQVKKFMVTALKIPTETVNNITFHRVHSLGPRGGQRPRPIIAKFEHYQQKMLVKSKGRELKGTSFGMNDQFPREINERRKVLYPILKEHRQKGNRTSLVVDKLYIDGQLFRHSTTTPWLF